MREPRCQTVARMLESGMTRDKIAEELSIEITTVHAFVCQARNAGFLPPIKGSGADRARYLMRKSGIKCGTFNQILGALTTETADWLVSQVVDGATMAETVAAIITDAYFEENE